MIEIELTKGKVALIDDDDFALVSEYTWCATEQSPGQWYAVNTALVPHLYMHTLLMNNARMVDHKDGDGLNNRRYNLRVCTNSQNQMNRKKLKRVVSSRYKGVSRYGTLRRWRAKIKLDGNQISLGYYDTEEEAALAYNKAAQELFGEFALLNDVQEIR